MVLSLSPQVVARTPAVTKGTTLTLSTATLPDLKGARVAMGGGPALVRDGKPMQWHNTQLRQPRTAIGWNSNYFFLVEVDGRQRGLSIGMTFPELAEYMTKLGCEEALNLDGGGSATFWLYGQVVNSPSEGRERTTGNGIVVVRKNQVETQPPPD
jgi:exopolysaccharide biosynthesis protein